MSDTDSTTIEKSPAERVEEILQEFYDGEFPTCRNCSIAQDEAAGDELCPSADEDGGGHEWDVVLDEPGEDEPDTQVILVQFGVEVPNDGYRYDSDIAGRLERMMALLLLLPIVTSVNTSGSESGSGYMGQGVAWPKTKANL